MIYKIYFYNKATFKYHPLFRFTMKTFVLSLGGSIIVPDKVDIGFLKAFRKLILKHPDTRFVIVCGGGMLCRKYQEAAKKINMPTQADLDWIGVKATWINATLVRAIFSDIAYEKVIVNPTERFKTDKKVIIAGGWKPGWSTDTDAVHLAKQLGAHALVNLSNIDYAYTDDPRKNPNAKKIEKTTWKEFRKIVGDKWIPGGNFPFDPVASKLAEEIKLKVIITKGTDLKNLDNILSDKKFKGTVIE
jgi:uridylate kinase